MRTLRERAEDPAVGDVVVSLTGHVRYEVMDLDVVDDVTQRVWARRETLEPVRPCDPWIAIDPRVWRDLVKLGAHS